MAERNITEMTEVSTKELADILGLTERRVQQMAQEGVIQKIAKNRFMLADSVQRYVKSVTREEKSEDDKKLEKARLFAETQIKTSKAAITKLEAEELKGNMHRSEDVAAVMEDLVYAMRGALNALPGRLAIDIVGAATPAEAAEIIKKEVYKIMDELAGYRYDPKQYEERVRARRNWSKWGYDDE